MKNWEERHAKCRTDICRRILSHEEMRTADTLRIRAKERRIESGLTQADVAELMGFESKVSITRFENGSQTISAPQLLTLAMILNTTSDYLLGRVDKPYI